VDAGGGEEGTLPVHALITPSIPIPRSVLLNGQRAFFASAGIHYPRFTQGQWDDVLLKVKSDGFNMVQTYFFANAHQPKTTTWPWIMEGPADLRTFIQKAGALGLFVNLRIGP
jgi:beta-galactosidase